MARPLSTEASAKERMRSAFWEMLEATPYDSLTVKEICNKAGVQRNTFYYHYEGIADLADDCLEALPVEEYATGLMRFLATEDAKLSDLVLSEQNAPLFEKIFLIGGPNGSPALIEATKDRMWGTWSSLMGMPGKRPIAVDFALGGIVSVLGRIGTMDPEERRRHIDKVPARAIFKAVFKDMGMSDFKKAQGAAGSWRE